MLPTVHRRFRVGRRKSQALQGNSRREGEHSCQLAHWECGTVRRECNVNVVDAMLMLRIITLVFICGMSNAALASTTRGDRQHLDVQWLKNAADMYFADTGQYPTTDALSTWFQKLVNANYIQAERLWCGTPTGAPLPIDLFGQPLVYELPTPTVPSSAVVRCIGPDGIDNYGAGDDLDSRYGPNLGYWNKAAWPRFYVYVVGGLLLTITATIIAWLVSRRAAVSFAVLLLAMGVFVGVVVASQFSAGFFNTTAARLPEWGDVLCGWSCLGVPAGLGGLIWFGARRIVHRKKRFDLGLCPNCAYPIGASPVCTECGLPLPMTR